jgi:hypothetical protein
MQRTNRLSITLSAFSLLPVAAAGACGSVEASDPIEGDHRADGGSAGDPDDQVAPEIVAISPEPGSTVLEDFSMVITFSEPMDAASVERAFVLPERADPVFTWNPTGDQLTVEPRARYPQSDDPARRVVDVGVGAGATDRSGNALGADHTVGYTLQYARLEAVFPFAQTLSGNCYAGYTASSAYTFFMAGENVNDPDRASRGFLTIPFSLPDEAVIERAVLQTEIEYLEGDPFGFGDLTIDDVEFTAINGTSFAAAGSDLGVLFAAQPAPAVGDRASLVVTGSFADDYAHRVERGHRTQFRIRFPHDDPADPAYSSVHADQIDDQVRLLRPQTTLTVTYLVE